MIQTLVLIPWALTIGFLFYILVRNRQMELREERDMDDMPDATIRVAVSGDKAYWVYNNVFYEAEVTKEPDFDTAKAIDTMSMSEKELKNLFIILDELEDSERE
jgi:hypothetical protein